jgi:RND family efflux transporter MFP subunit
MRSLIFVLGTLFALAGYASNPTVVVRKVEEVGAAAPVHVSGAVRSRNDVLLPARAEGQLMWSLEEGTRVAKGDVLAQLDRKQLELQLQEQQLLAERAAVNLRYLEGEVDRLQQLERNNLAAKTQLAEMTSRRDLAKNDKSVARARIERLQDSLSRTEIVSPVDGVIVERIKEKGEYARIGETVARVVDPVSLEVTAAVPVANLNRIDFDSPVTVTLGSLQFEAELRSVIHAGNQRSQTFDVIVDIPRDLAVTMVAGQFVEVDIPLLTLDASLYVPRDAVVLRTGGNYVFRIGEDNVAQRIGVVLGEGRGKMVSVRSEKGTLTIGDRVAIRGIERLQDGQEVVPVAS